MHGWLAQFGGENVEVRSAGVETHGVNPKAIQVMAEVDVDITHHSSNNIEEYLHENFDSIITVCDHAKESCPVFPSTAEQVHHNFPDPAKATGTDDEILGEFRQVRDMIRDFAKSFLSTRLV